MFFNKMARNTKKKLVIFAGTFKWLIYAEAKYCASELGGEIKYTECSRTEYCCALGCCEPPGLHFHHLWYYWILAIIMFLVCSGGGWWYRHWLQRRYRAAASAIPSRSSNTRPQNSLRGQTCQAQRARITYNSARNTVLLHRMWKGPQRNGSTPAYNGNATTSTYYQNMSVMLNDANCPYYQLYGPPPSYETVIAQSRGKLPDPASPESSNARPKLQSTTNVIPNPGVPQCFSYACSPSARLNNGLDQEAQYQNGTSSPRQLDSHEGIPFPFVPLYCVANGPVRQNICVPFEYQEQNYVPGDGFPRGYQTNAPGYLPYSVDKASDTSDPENQSHEETNAERYTMLNIDCAAGSSREHGSWETEERSISRVHGKTERGIGGRIDRNRVQHRRESLADASIFSSVMEEEEEGEEEEEEDEEEEEEDEEEEEEEGEEDEDEEETRVTKNASASSRILGSSFKSSARYAGSVKREEYSTRRPFSRSLPRSCEGIATTDRLSSEKTSPADEPACNASTSLFRSSPSNNVILESFVSDDATENVENEERRPCIMNGSTNSDLESKHRLDRSKSLD